MIKEKFQQITDQISLSIAQSQVQSVRKKAIKRTAVRLYDDNKIGIHGGFGDVDEKDLVLQAKSNLNLNIPYPCEPTKNTREEKNLDCSFSDNESFISEVESALEELRAKHPKFLFSNKASLTKSSTILTNDADTHLSHIETTFDIGLLVKEKASANIMDAFVSTNGRKYDRREFMRVSDEILSAYHNKMDIKPGNLPVIFFWNDYTYLKKLLEAMNGTLYGGGSSLFKGKMGEKLFNEKVSVAQTKNPEEVTDRPFFDFEGTVNKDYKYDLIKNGVFVTPFTDKKTAEKYNLPLTGSASGEFDSVPDLGFVYLSLARSGETAKELLNGQKGIFVFMASGGDFTPDGHFATPVQLSYLFDGENLVGRLPELNISSHLYDMLGKDFIGVSKDSFIKNEPAYLTIMNMKVEKLYK